MGFGGIGLCEGDVEIIELSVVVAAVRIRGSGWVKELRSPVS